MSEIVQTARLAAHREARIVQVNRSRGGLPKTAVQGPVRVTEAGVEGDWQRNRKYHGGPDKAVLIIAAEAIDELAARGFPVQYGSLGENLTVLGLDRTTWQTGTRIHAGEGVLLELTTQRIPCQSLDPYAAGSAPLQKELYDAACKAGDQRSPRWANGGFYARVVREGIVFAGAGVRLAEVAA